MLMNVMLRDLIVNAAIIMSVIHLGGQLLKGHPLDSRHSQKIIWITGLGNGILGVILLEFSIHISDGVMTDLRHIPVLIAAVYGGPLSSVIAGVFIGVGRVSLFSGGWGFSATIGFFTSVVVGICFGLLSYLPLNRWAKGTIMNFAGLLITSIALFIAIPNLHVYCEVVFYLWIVGLITGFLVFNVTEYTRRDNELFHQMKDQAAIDFLTGLRNVREFDHALHDLLAKQARGLVLLLIDVDHFKAVNDTYGHRAGDAVLRDLGRIFARTAPNEAVFRYGGEEFSVILVKSTPAEAHELAERIRHDVEIHSFAIPSGDSLSITISIGISFAPNDSAAADDLVQAADTALYKAKRSGRNRVCIFAVGEGPKE